MRSKLLVLSGTYLKAVRKHTAASKLLRLSLAVCAKSGVKIEDCGFRTMQEVPSTPSVIKLHFEGEPGSKSFNSWREEFARKFLEMEMEPLDSELFRISVRLDALPGVVSCNGLGTPQRSYSPPGAVQSSGDFVVLMPRGMRMRYEQSRLAEEASNGSVTLNDTSRPWRLDTIDSQLKLTATRIPRQNLLALVPN